MKNEQKSIYKKWMIDSDDLIQPKEKTNKRDHDQEKKKKKA